MEAFAVSLGKSAQDLRGTGNKLCPTLPAETIAQNP
jgi:hypothetical protein